MIIHKTKMYHQGHQQHERSSTTWSSTTRSSTTWKRASLMSRLKMLSSNFLLDVSCPGKRNICCYSNKIVDITQTSFILMIDATRFAFVVIATSMRVGSFYLKVWPLWQCSLYHWSPWTLTHWGRVTHICVSKLSIINSNNGLAPDRRQAIIWTNAGILLIGSLGTNYSDILIEIHTF